jgi:hypothetical protein
MRTTNPLSTNSDELSGDGTPTQDKNAHSFMGFDKSRVSFEYPFLRQIDVSDDLYFLHEKINTRCYRRQKD